MKSRRDACVPPGVVYIPETAYVAAAGSDYLTARKYFSDENLSSLDKLETDYKGLAKQYHPDVNGSPDAGAVMTEINNAHDAALRYVSSNIIDQYMALKQQNVPTAQTEREAVNALNAIADSGMEPTAGSLTASPGSAKALPAANGPGTAQVPGLLNTEKGRFILNLLTNPQIKSGIDNAGKTGYANGEPLPISDVAGYLTKVIGKKGGDAGKPEPTVPPEDSDDDFKSAFVKSLDGILQKQGLTVDGFNVLRLKDVATLTGAEKSTLKAIRESIPMPDQNTAMQKIIPAGDIKKYLDGTYTRVGGFVARVMDVSHLKAFMHLFKSLRLDYPNTPYDPAAGGTFGIIVFKTPDASSFEIPYSPEMGGTKVAAPPFTGNGFIKSTNGQIIPEFASKGRMALSDGSELYKVDADGTRTLIAIYSDVDECFKPTE